MIKEIYDYLVIVNSNLFDERFYLLSYPDVRKADIDPLWHFVRWGWKEGRNPNADLSTRSYFHKFPYLLIENVNPLIHLIKNKYKSLPIRVYSSNLGINDE